MADILVSACDELADEYGLTRAERQVVILVVNGLTPKEIALRRHRSVETIRTQIKSVREKLGVCRISTLSHAVFRSVEKTTTHGQAVQ